MRELEIPKKKKQQESKSVAHKEQTVEDAAQMDYSTVIILILFVFVFVFLLLFVFWYHSSCNTGVVVLVLIYI